VDPTVYTRESFLRLLTLARKHRLPLVIFAREFVEAGAVAALDTNPYDLGSQAAVVAAEILQGKAAPAELGVSAPLGTVLVLNSAAADAIGLPLSQAVTNLADRIFTSIGEVTDEDTDGGGLVTPPEPRPGDRDPFAETVSEMDMFAVQEEIVAVASRHRQKVSEAPSVVSVLTADDLAVLGARTLAEALQLLPGVTARYTRLGTYELLVRGQKKPADLLVLLDGIRLSSMVDGSVLYDMSLDDVARIEVIRGPGSALYGSNAFAGVVSIVTHRPGERDAAAADGTWFPAASAGHAGHALAGSAHARGSYTPGRWRLGLHLGVRHSQGAELIMPLDVTGVFGDLRLLNDEKFLGDAYVHVDAKDVLSAGDSLVLAPKLLLYESGPNFGPAETLATDSRLRRWILIAPLHYTVPLGTRLTLEGRLSYDLQAVDHDVQIRPDGFTNRANPIPAPDGLRKRARYAASTLGAEARALIALPRLRIWDEHSITAGVSAEYGFISGFAYDQNYAHGGTLQYYENFSDARKQMLMEAGLAEVTGFQNYDMFQLGQRDADRVVLSAYGESMLRLAKNPLGTVWLTSGLRFDRFSDYRAPDDTGSERKVYTTLNPRGALVWSPSLWGTLDGVTVKLMYGTAFRAPSFQELYDTTTQITEEFFQIPNALLEPQTTEVWEAGLELHPIALVTGFLAGAQARRVGQRYANTLTARLNAYSMTTDDNLDFDPSFNPAGNQVINLPGQRVTGYELEGQWRMTPRDLAFVNYSRLKARQLGTCTHLEADGTCRGENLIVNHELTEIPRTRLNVGVSLRPVGLPLELWGRRRGALHRWLGPIAISAVFRRVSASKNNARVTFEALNFRFVHPGYQALDLGLTYRLPLGGDDEIGWFVQMFATNVLDDDVAEPIVIKLDPLPDVGYLLPRPGRAFFARVLLRY
jgi:outer membrane receptor protein involved in Fe transport